MRKMPKLIEKKLYIDTGKPFWVISMLFLALLVEIIAQVRTSKKCKF